MKTFPVKTIAQRLPLLLAGIYALFNAAAVWSQSTQPAAGALVVLRSLNEPDKYALQTFEDGQPPRTQTLSRVSFYARSEDRFVSISMRAVDSAEVQVFSLPKAEQLASFTVTGVLVPALKMGAAEMGVIVDQNVYFTAYAGPRGVFVIANLQTGAFTTQPIPPGRTGSSNLQRMGDFIVAGTQFAYQAFSVTEAKFSKSIPILDIDPYTIRGRTVFVPGDGMYCWNILGDFTRIADASLEPVPDAQRIPQTIARGVFDAESAGSGADSTLVVLTGPSRNGDLRNEAIEPTLTFAKPSEKSILGKIKLDFTPGRTLTHAGAENTMAVVNPNDDSLIKFDATKREETARFILPPLENRGRSEEPRILYWGP